MKSNNWKRNTCFFFIVSRILLWLIGIRFEVNYDFMYFHAVDQIENNFWESLLYTHAFNPGMNILAWIDLSLPYVLQLPFYILVFQALSLLLLISMGKILSLFQFKDFLIFGTLAFFSITPAFIYFETFLIYTLPSAALLMLISYQFYRGISENTKKQWLLFFIYCVILSFLRSSYHLIWIVAVFIGIVIIDFKHIKEKIIGFTFSTSLIFLWYYKNYLLFGFFGASSWGGFNFHFTTTSLLDSQEKIQLVEEEKMSSLVKIPIYSNINSYSDFVDLSDKQGVAILDDTHRENGLANYNHIKFIELSRKKMEDSKQFVKLFPLRYLKRVLQGFVDYHRPSTCWHPHDKKHSPHIPNRQIIGYWENTYNNIIHFPFTLGVGFYLLLIPMFFYTMVRLSLKFLGMKQLSLEEKLMTFITWNILFLMLVSCLVTYSELERYRFITEGLIWISTLYFLTQHFDYFKNKFLRSS